MDEIQNQIQNKSLSVYNNQNDFKPLLDKPLFIRTFTWLSNVVSNGNIATAAINIPTDLLVNSVIRAPFLTSTFWRGKICIRYQVTATPMHQGALLLYFKPNNGLNTTLPSSSINDAIVAPSVLLYANQSTPACLEIPFCCPTNVATTTFDTTGDYYNFRPTKFSTDLGAVYAKVIVPLDSQSTLSVPVSVHVTFKEIEFFVPRNGYMTAPALLNAGINEFETTESRKELLDRQETKVTFQSGVLEMLAMTALPSVGSLIKDGIDRIGKKLFKTVGLDKPTNPIVSEAERMTTTTNFNHNEGVVPLDRLTMVPSHVTTADSDTFPSEIDEMDMKYILSKEQFIANFVTKDSDAVGKCLFSVPMGPMCVPLKTGANDGTPLITRFSMLTKYWRGSIKFHFKFAMSDMQTAKLMFVKAYGIGRFTNFPSVLDLSNYDTETYEINKGGQEVVITCNYNAATEMCYNTMDYLTSLVQHGQLFVYLLQPLQYPQSCKNYITCSVYVSAGDDFAFYGPAEYQYVRPNNLTTDIPKIKFQSGVTSGENSKHMSNDTFGLTKGNNESEETVVPSTVPSHSSNTTAPLVKSRPRTHNMAPITHIRDIVRRYVQFNAFNAEDVKKIEIAEIFRNIQLCSIFTHISDFYHVFKGGLRFRMVLPELIQGQKVKAYYRYPLPDNTFLNPNNFPPSAILPARTLTAASFTYVYDAEDTNGPVYVPLMITINQMDCCLDFEITCENVFRFNYIHQNSNLTAETDINADLGTLLIAFPPDYVGKEVEMFVAAADEARFGLLVHNPPIFIHVPSVNSDIRAVFPVNTLGKYFFAAV